MSQGKKAKLFVGEQLNDQKVQFLILQDQVIGKGSFGQVKKAVRKDRPNEQLAVKIVPYQNQSDRLEIQKQISILRRLPRHPNLVNILPYKCFSQHNFYIFMQYCQGGTLKNLMGTKNGAFTQNQLFDIFYQLMNGYKVLWEAKILHEDLKLDNVLVKNGFYKLADFGLSILYEGVKQGKKRVGTLPYMPIQKIIKAQYYANPKSDVYSLGIILFQLITGHHPYIRNKHKQMYGFVTQLIKSQLFLKPNFSNKFSLKFQHFFDLVLKMIAKKEQSRINFDEVFQYIRNQQIFQQIQKKVESIKEEKLQVEDKNFIITDYTDAIVIDFQVPENEQGRYQKQIMEKNIKKKAELQNEILKQIEDFIVSRRIIVYYFDRLTRRLYVQKLKNKQKQINNCSQLIISLILLSKKIIQSLIKQSKTGQMFGLGNWKNYKKSSVNLIRMIQRDENYLQDLIVDCLSEKQKVNTNERKQILDKSKLSLEQFKQFIKLKLIDLYHEKSSVVKPDDRQNLITLCYICSGIQILQNYETMQQEAVNLQNYFRMIETQESQVLFNKVINNFITSKVQFAIDLGQEQF